MLVSDKRVALHTCSSVHPFGAPPERKYLKLWAAIFCNPERVPVSRDEIQPDEGPPDLHEPNRLHCSLVERGVPKNSVGHAVMYWQVRALVSFDGLDRLSRIEWIPLEGEDDTSPSPPAEQRCSVRHDMVRRRLDEGAGLRCQSTH